MNVKEGSWGHSFHLTFWRDSSRWGGTRPLHITHPPTQWEVPSDIPPLSLQYLPRRHLMKSVVWKDKHLPGALCQLCLYPEMTHRNSRWEVIGLEVTDNSQVIAAKKSRTEVTWAPAFGACCWKWAFVWAQTKRGFPECSYNLLYFKILHYWYHVQNN